MTDTWTTAYLAALVSPADPLPIQTQPRAFSAQTVRQAVRLRRGGTALRVVMSNEFGQTSLVIDEITVSNNNSGTMVPALCHGSPRWNIAAGQTAVSDPVIISTTAGDDLLIGTFIAGSTGP